MYCAVNEKASICVRRLQLCRQKLMFYKARLITVKSTRCLKQVELLMVRVWHQNDQAAALFTRFVTRETLAQATLTKICWMVAIVAGG